MLLYKRFINVIIPSILHQPSKLIIKEKGNYTLNNCKILKLCSSRHLQSSYPKWAFERGDLICRPLARHLTEGGEIAQPESVGFVWLCAKLARGVQSRDRYAYDDFARGDAVFLREGFIDLFVQQSKIAGCKDTNFEGIVWLIIYLWYLYWYDFINWLECNFRAG